MNFGSRHTLHVIEFNQQRYADLERSDFH